MCIQGVIIKYCDYATVARKYVTTVEIQLCVNRISDVEQVWTAVVSYLYLV